MGSRWIWGALAVAVVVGALAWRLLDDGGDSDSARSGSDTPAAAGEPSGDPVAEPSGVATREIDASDLELYLRTGRELGLDWTVIAAVDRLDSGGAGTVAAEERVGAIAYSLRGTGAQHDYATALIAFGGSHRYADRVLDLADRYRKPPGRPQSTDGPLSLPVDGQVLAAYGQRYGLLHDGIDVAAATGEPIRAAATGLTVSTGFSGVYGEYTCLLHRFRPPLAGAPELTTCYGNQSAYETEPGERVQAGEVIGRVGCSGPCLRPHLHFQVRLGRSTTAPPADPVPFLAAGVRIEAGRPLEAG